MTAVSVQFNPRRSATMSAKGNQCKSAPTSRTQFSLKRMESKADIISGSVAELERKVHLHPEKSEVLDELLLLYGVNSYKYFDFSNSTSTWIAEIRPRIGTAWLCNNEAFRQMYSTSALYPRRRLGSATRFSLPTITPTSTTNQWNS